MSKFFESRGGEEVLLDAALREIGQRRSMKVTMQTTSMIKPSGNVKIPDDWKERFLTTVQQASRMRQKLKERLAEVQTFSEYLTLLCAYANKDEGTLADECGMSEEVITNLKTNRISPWEFEATTIIALVDAVYGSLEDALEVIRRTPITVSDQLVHDSAGTLVARSHRSVRQKERREGLLNVSKRMIELDLARKKEQLLQAIVLELE